MSSVAVSTETSLFDLAVEVKEIAELALGNTSEGVPALSYVTAGAPAYDCCPALIVWVPALTEDATNPLAPIMATAHRASLGRINLAEIRIDILRCSAVMGTNGRPTPTQEEAVAAIVLEDAWVLWTGFYQEIQAGAFRDTCSEVYFDGGLSIDDQGGCVGWEMTLRVMLHGIPIVSG